MDNHLAGFRDFFAEYVTAHVDVKSPAIVESFRRVARERFLGQGPWQVVAGKGYVSTRTDDPRVLYQDSVVAIDVGRGVNNGQPSLHALSLSHARVRPGDNVVQVGTGTGYYTAILAELVTASGKVLGFEVAPDLAERADSCLAGCANARVFPRSPLNDRLEPADVIYVCAGMSTVPTALLDCLKVRGRMVAPLVTAKGHGAMLLLERIDSDRFSAELFAHAHFIACAGAQDSDGAESIARALSDRSWREVKSLRRYSIPDQSFWCGAKDWWLSTQQA
jgi:protein-L-isoaspartate(D-aspartate) O-methyltransferase